jgi:Lysozyme like domain
LLCSERPPKWPRTQASQARRVSQERRADIRRLTLTAVLVAVVLTIGWTRAASSDNYGNATPAVKARMVRLIHRTFDRYGVSGVMLCIVNRESGFAPTAANWRDSNGGSFGLFQINGIWRHRGESTAAFARRMFNPYANAAVAVQLYRASGLRPWGNGC